jgi:hypothetical protein
MVDLKAFAQRLGLDWDVALTDARQPVLNGEDDEQLSCSYSGVELAAGGDAVAGRGTVFVTTRCALVRVVLSGLAALKRHIGAWLHHRSLSPARCNGSTTDRPACAAAPRRRRQGGSCGCRTRPQPAAAVAAARPQAPAA